MHSYWIVPISGEDCCVWLCNEKLRKGNIEKIFYVPECASIVLKNLVDFVPCKNIQQCWKYWMKQYTCSHSLFCTVGPNGSESSK